MQENQPNRSIEYQSINQSMALSASCAGHTSTQSHAALYKIINEVVMGISMMQPNGRLKHIDPVGR